MLISRSVPVCPRVADRRYTFDEVSFCNENFTMYHNMKRVCRMERSLHAEDLFYSMQKRVGTLNAKYFVHTQLFINLVVGVKMVVLVVPLFSFSLYMKYLLLDVKPQPDLNNLYSLTINTLLVQLKIRRFVNLNE